MLQRGKQKSTDIVKFHLMTFSKNYSKKLSGRKAKEQFMTLGLPHVENHQDLNLQGFLTRNVESMGN